MGQEAEHAGVALVGQLECLDYVPANIKVKQKSKENGALWHL